MVGIIFSPCDTTIFVFCRDHHQDCGRFVGNNLCLSFGRKEEKHFPFDLGQLMFS
jgi:hypothetical protein